MKFNVYAIWDDKAKAFLPPFVLLQDSVAVRSFADAVKTEGHAFSRNPEDYSLFHLGSWDDATGIMVSLTPKAFLVGGIQLRALASERARMEAEIAGQRDAFSTNGGVPG